MLGDWGSTEGTTMLEILHPSLSDRVMQLAKDQSDDNNPAWPVVQEWFEKVVEAGLKEHGYQNPHIATEEQEREFYETLKKDYERYQKGKFMDQFDENWKKQLYEDFVPPDPDEDFNWSWEDDE